MSANKNKMSNHLDSSVIRFFILAFFVSASVLAYRATRYSPCKEVVFIVKTKDLVEGKLVKFVDNTSNAVSWEWDFDDGSKVITNKEALHVFKKQGAYNVRLRVNGICQEVQKIIIKERPFIIDVTKLAVFNLPASIIVGEELVLSDKTPNATTWEWRFGETAGVNSKKKLAKYTYETPGLKTVSLIVNGDIKHATNKKIDVLPLRREEVQVNVIASVNRTVGRRISNAPTSEALGQHANASNTDKDEIPYITGNSFKKKLMLVSQKKLTADAFKEYLCGDLNKTIIVNGEKTTFLEFCELIKEKNLKVKEVKLYRNDNNCITNITIKRSKYIL